MYDNTIMNSKSHAILIKNASSANTFYSNKIISASKQGLSINQDPTSSNNTFSNNQVITSGAEAASASPASAVKHQNHSRTITKSG
jgi:Tfp pilus assembly protein PilE